MVLSLVTLCLGETLEVSLTVPSKNSKNKATFFFVRKIIRSTLIHDSHVFRSAFRAAVAECRFLQVLTRIGVDVGVLADVRLFLQVPRKRR